MGLYFNEEVVSNINLVNSIIRRDLTNYETNQLFSKIVLESEELFLNTAILTAWMTFYSHFTNERKLLDDNSQFNQETITEYVKFNADMYAKDRIQFLSDLLRVLYEFHFWTGKLRGEGIVSDEFLTILADKYEDYEDKTTHFQYVRDGLAIAMVQWLLRSQSFTEAKGLIKNIQDKKEVFIEEITTLKVENLGEINLRETEAIKNINDNFAAIKNEIKTNKETVEESMKSISESLVEINALEKRVQDLKSEYNFVGLSSGFNKIKEKKEQELRSVEVNYKNLFGCIFIVPVIITILHLTMPGLFPKDLTVLFLALPFFTIEMALIYFFRLSYLEAKSIRTQLVQIELRLSLCSFIDGYVEYRKKNSINIDKVLEIFDSLIFSPIQTNENNIPSMFDGIEALAGLAEKITKK
jgi:archaellum component FlaC